MCHLYLARMTCKDWAVPLPTLVGMASCLYLIFLQRMTMAMQPRAQAAPQKAKRRAAEAMLGNSYQRNGTTDSLPQVCS